MANSTSMKALQGQSNSTRKKKSYLDLLAHYDVELVQTDGPIRVVRCKTGTELCLEPKVKLQMLKLLLSEFGTLGGTNKAIQNYRAAHS